MFKILIGGRYGKQYAQDLAMYEDLKAGGHVTFIGVKSEGEAQNISDRLLENHKVATIFEPVYRSQRPVPHFDMSDPETPITHYTYPEKVLTGYRFKMK